MSLSPCRIPYYAFNILFDYKATKSAIIVSPLNFLKQSLAPIELWLIEASCSFRACCSDVQYDSGARWRTNRCAYRFHASTADTERLTLTLADKFQRRIQAASVTDSALPRHLLARLNTNDMWRHNRAGDPASFPRTIT